MLVTAYGSGTVQCKVGRWHRSGNDTLVDVYGFDLVGKPADTRFTLSFMTDVGIGIRHSEDSHYGGYIRVEQATSTPSTPDRAYQLNTAGGVNTVTRVSPGVYRVNLPRLAPSTSTIAMVVAYGSSGEYCAVQGWGSDGQGGTNVTVNGWSPGQTLQEIEIDRIRIGGNVSREIIESTLGFSVVDRVTPWLPGGHPADTGFTLLYLTDDQIRV